ncbi:MAG TPA: DUF1080 domain-containing protein [Gemmatimonadaceae bacterium]|jgi:hypothetical protein
MYGKAGTRAMTFAASAVLLIGCASASQSADQMSNSTGWRTLFDGTSMNAFRGYRSQTMPKGWSIVNGELTKSGSVEDLVTREKFGNFELSFDWKLGPGGNGGVMYRVTEEYDHPYWSGPEYQLLDDARHPDGKSRLTAAGADYALYPSPAGVVKPADQWNSSLIVVQGNHVQHWMNGQKLLEYDLLSPDWAAKVKASKFGAWPNYGRATSGYIAIQGDHDGVLAMRNIKIRELK